MSTTTLWALVDFEKREFTEDTTLADVISLRSNESIIARKTGDTKWEVIPSHSKKLKRKIAKYDHILKKQSGIIKG